MTNRDSANYREFETAVLALATVICPQEIHCQMCRNKAAKIVEELGRR